MRIEYTLHENDYLKWHIKFNKIKNKILLDALFKSDARGDGKQESLLYGLNHSVTLFWSNLQSNKTKYTMDPGIYFLMKINK